MFEKVEHIVREFGIEVFTWRLICQIKKFNNKIPYLMVDIFSLVWMCGVLSVLFIYFLFWTIILIQ